MTVSPRRLGQSPSRKAQAATEYLMLLGGALLFVLFVILMLRGNILPSSTNKIESDVKSYLDKYSGEYVFFDNFDSDSADRWIPESGTWKAANHEYFGTGAGQSYIDLTLVNFSYNAKVRSTQGPVGLIFRRLNSTNYYSLGLTPSGSQVSVSLDKVVRGTSGNILPPTVVDGDLSKGVFVRLDVQADFVSVYINTVKVGGNYTDTSFDAGLFGLYVANADQQAFFDNLYIVNCVGQCNAG